MIEVSRLSKFYEDVEALNGVGFSVKTGEVIGLLGPNGAGKTTLMKILTGFTHPSAGSARVGGYDVLEETEQVQAMIGYLPENAPIYPELTVQSYLKMIADLRSIPQDKQMQYISEAVYAVGLEDRLIRPIGELSKGYRQRVGLAQAILHKPKLLILDEPTNGLDPTQIVEVRHLIKKLSKNSTVLLSTHILSEVEATCDRVIIIMRGQVKSDAKLSEMAATSHALLTVTDQSDRAAIEQALRAIPGVENVGQIHESEKVVFRVEGNSDADLCPQIYDLAKKNDWPLCELQRQTQTLEAVFNQLTVVEGGVQ